MRAPFTVSSFRGPDPSAAGTANVGDTTLRIVGTSDEGGGDEVLDLVFPGASPEVFAAVRKNEAALSALLNGAQKAAGTPTFTSITPATAVEETAEEVVIEGTGFQPGVQVFIGGAPCTDIVVADDGTEIECTTPDSLAAGDHDIVIVNPNAEVAIEVEGFEATSAE